MFRLTTLLLPILHLASAYTKLSDPSLSHFEHPGADFDIQNGKILAPILQVRVPGTDGIIKVRQHFLDYFKTELPDWKISLQNSTQKTALGTDVDFVNVIATRDPPWARTGEVERLALVAHYDSKITPTGFIGAVDSAAPCAMMLYAAKAIDAALTAKWKDMEAKGETDGLEGEKGIQLLLLDGEEAFVSWSDTDSVYGARALAEEWENTFHPALSTFQTPLHEIELFVLLDLLGSKDPKVPSYFKTTHWAYKNMAELEGRLRSQNHFKSAPQANPNNKEASKEQAPQWFHDINKDPNSGIFMGGMVQDDHLPFMARGVEILHLIPSPFPHVWHRKEDDGEHLDMPTTEDWAVLTAAFAAEWMDLEGFLEPPKKVERSSSGEEVLDRRKDDEGRDELFIV